MGIVMSYFIGSSGSNQPDPVTGLSPKQISLVQNSWSQVKKDLMGAGVELFMIFFKRFPQYQKMFPFRNIPYDQLRTNEKLQAHAANVMYALCAIIDNIKNNNILISLLTNSGKSHARKKIPEQAYEDLKLCVLELLQNAFGPKLTQDTREAWDKTLTVAFSVILKEFKQGDTEE